MSRSGPLARRVELEISFPKASESLNGGRVSPTLMAFWKSKFATKSAVESLIGLVI